MSRQPLHSPTRSLTELVRHAAEGRHRLVFPSEVVAGSSAFVPVLTAALPGFAELPESVRRGLSDDLIDDVYELNVRYQQFLTRHGLYETAVFAGHAPLATAERWVLVAPELADDYPPFADRLTAIPSRTPQADPARLQVHRFPAFADELGLVSAQIAELLDRGVEQSQIALTVGGLEEEAERLDEEAERYEIPLRIRHGRPLLETVLLQPGVPWPIPMVPRASVRRYASISGADRWQAYPETEARKAPPMATITLIELARGRVVYSA